VRGRIVPPESHAADDFGGCPDDRISLRGIKNTSDGRPFEPNQDREEKEQEAEWIGKIAGIECVAPKRINPEEGESGCYKNPGKHDRSFRVFLGDPDWAFVLAQTSYAP
jgi:hypothetical protein